MGNIHWRRPQKLTANWFDEVDKVYKAECEKMGEIPVSLDKAFISTRYFRLNEPDNNYHPI